MPKPKAAPKEARRPRTSTRGPRRTRSSRRSTQLGKEGVWRVGGQDLKLTNLDKVLFPPLEGSDEEPITKRELIRYFARIAPTMLPHLADRPLNLQRFPNGAAAPASGRRTCPTRRPGWLNRWVETGVEEREDRNAEHAPARRPGRDAVLARQPGRVRDPRLDLEAPRPVEPDVRADRHRSRRQDDLGGDGHARAAVPDRVRAPRRPRLPEAHRQARHPGVDPDRAGQVQLRGHERVGREGVAGRRRDGAGPDLVGVGEGGAARQGPARLHAERVDQDAGRAVCRAARSGCAGVGADRWEELDDPDLRPNRWTIRDVVERVEQVGDLFAAAQTDPQELPKV